MAHPPDTATATGLSTDQIAVELLLSHATVRNYLSKAMAKLDVKGQDEVLSDACTA